MPRPRSHGSGSEESLQRLPRAFFARDTVRVARDLVGALLVRRLDGELLVARIVETEAYRGDEPACHAYRNAQRLAQGEAPRGRSALLFAGPATAYVYFSYGVHWLFNVVTEKEDTAGAVLLRAIEPLRGIERMRRLRPAAKRDRDLGSGPGKLTRALAIGPEFNARPLHSSRELYFARGEARVPRAAVVAGPRVGISQAKALQWRFCLRDHPCVSR